MLDNVKVILGRMIRVQNLNKRSTQNNVYIAIQVQDEDGQNERCLLFTEIELADTKQIYSSFLMKNLITGRLYKFQIGKSIIYIMKIINRSNQEKIIRLTKGKLLKAQFRAQKNKEDLTKKDFLTDILD